MMNFKVLYEMKSILRLTSIATKRIKLGMASQRSCHSRQLGEKETRKCTLGYPDGETELTFLFPMKDLLKIAPSQLFSY